MSRQEQQQEMALDISISSEDQEDSNWIDCTEELALSSFSRFKDLRNAGHLSDVVIEATDGKQFPAHRVVLAATVPFFDLMFNSEMVEARSATVRLTNIDAETLETIIGFAYTGRIKAAFKNMERLLRAADYLQLRILSRHCADILKARLNERNVFSIRRFALAYNVPQAAIDADLWIQRNFMFISKTDDFAQLDFGTLRQILDWDQLYVDSEERVFEAVIHWLNYDLPSRGVFAPELLTLVRMPLLRPSFLIDEVSRHPLIWNDMMCRNIVDEAKNYHLVPERRSLFKTIFKTTIRVCVQMPGVIYALGGINHIQQETPSAVEVYDPKMKRWTVTKPMMSPRTRIGVAVSDGQIYVVGGYNGVERLRCVEVFDTATDTWKLLPSLHKRRSAMCAVALGEEIFVIGGYDGSNALDSVEAYEIKYKRWTMKRTMLSRRCAAGIAVVKGLIYVIGGHNGVQIFNSVECYDPVLDSWKMVAPMLNARCRLSATAYLDKIYVVGGYNDSNFLHTAEVYDPETDCWTHIAAMRMSRARVSLVTNGNLIYAIGGYDGENNISSMEIYNPATDHWEYGPSMVAHEGGVGAIAVPSPMQIKRTRNLKRPYGSRKQPPSDNGSPPAAAGTSSMRECGDEQLE